MKQSIGTVLLAAVLFCSITVLPVCAADVGDVIFPIDVRDRSRAGVVYESINRGLDVTSGPEATRSIKADALYIRINTDIGQMATFDFDIGAIKPDGGDYDYYVGGGLRFLVFDAAPIRITTFAQIHYSPMETKRGGTKTDYDYLEAEGGALCAIRIPIDNQVTFIPYAGPVLSVIRLDGDTRNAESGTKADFDAEEKNLIGLAAGLGLKLKEHHSIRAELRYFDSVSFSIAAAIAF